MSNYDDPSWYEQDSPSDQTQQPGPADRFPQRIHNDAPNTSLPGMYGAQSQKKPTGQFYTGNASNRRNGGSASRTGQIVVSLALVIIAFTGGWFGHQIYSGLLSSSSNQSSYYANLFQQAWSIIDQNYVDRKAVNYKEMSYAAIRSMLAVLNDKGHTYFLTPQEVQAQQQQLSGTSSGIGIYINQDPKTKQVIITATVPGAPAEKAGFKSGDIIVAVNHTSVVGKDSDTVHNLIEGKLGTSVAITVQRPPTNQQLTISVTRADFKIPGVIMHYIAESHIAHIQILGFDSGVSDQLKTNLSKAKHLGATSIVLDLRDNPGGYLEEAINTASEFLKSGNVLLEQDSSGNRTPDPVTGHPIDTQIPIVVLVNSNTASAAEIVSGALKDNKRAIIMGTTTLGTGTVLNEFDLPDGSAIYLGVMEWLTPNGNFIRDKGIAPDITVTLHNGATSLTANVENQRNMTLQQILASGDNQLAAAINYLQTHP
jgi:carboxyl-terminal processing protease